MKRLPGFVSIFLLLILLLTACLSPMLLMSDSDAKVLTKFSDGTSEMVIDFPGTGTKEFLIPADSNVTKVTINFTTMANDQGIYPENIELKFGEMLPIDWAYHGTGHGAYGYQEYFTDSQVRVNLSYDGSDVNDTLSFLLPRNADVSSAKLTLTAYEYDHWEKGITELNIPDDVTWNQDPYPFEYQNQLFVFYRDYNSTQTDESDGDITYQTSTNGQSWSSAVELTPSGDTPDGYPGNGPTHLAGDFHPVVIEFKGRMGVFWGSMSFDNIPNPGSWGGITNGSDRDIVARWRDGSSWGNYVEITHPTDNANESNYTRNTDDDPDPDAGSINPWHKDDRRPNVAVFKDKIYAIWTSNNTGNTSFRNHNESYVEGEPNPWWQWNHRGDIIISSSSTGNDGDWSHGYDLTAGDRWWDIDFAPSLCVWNDTLFAIWETNAPRYWNDSGIWRKKVDVATKYDWDIVYRYTTDGVTWSDFIEMTPKNDTPPDASGPWEAIPDEDPRLINFTDPVTGKNRLYCIWRTRNSNITNGSDYDIVISYTEDGLNWEDPVELTDPITNGGYDNKPELTIFNDKLYVVWRREQGERWADNPDGDIVTRHWDGKEWSVRQEITPFDGDGTGRDDFYPNSIEFNNKFYTTWVTRNRGKGWTEGTDADVVIRSMVPSDLPFNTNIAIGTDTNWYYSVDQLMTDANPSKTPDMTSTLQQLLNDDSYVTNNLWLDAYGNEFVKFNLFVKIPDPGRIRLDDLRIWYNCTLEVGDGETVSPEAGENPFSQKINDYIKENQDKADSNGFIPVKLEVISSVDGRVKMHDVFLNYNIKPTFSILTPASKPTTTTSKNETGTYTINWEDLDVDDNARISLYFHEGAFKKYEGEMIAENLLEDDEQDSFTWEYNESQLIEGKEYSIFGMITDGVSVIYSYAPGTLVVDWDRPAPPWIKITEPDGNNDAKVETFRIEWDDSGSDFEDPESGAEIQLYYVENYCNNISDNIKYNATRIDINNDGVIDDQDFIYENEDGRRGQYLWNIKHLELFKKYYISAIIDDGYNPPVFDCSDGQMWQTSIPPPSFRLESGKLIDEIDVVSNYYGTWETHSTRPKLAWDSSPGNDKFFLTVWEGSDSSGKMIYDSKNLTLETYEVNDQGASLEFGQNYYAELFATGLGGGKSPVVTLKFSVVNHLPVMPVVEIKPSSPTSQDPLECLEPEKEYDEDGDVITYSYRWTKTNASGEFTMEQFDDFRTIPAEFTAKGDVWKVSITPSDGIGIGTTGEISFVIGNALAVIDEIIKPDPSVIYYDNEELNIHAMASDPDGDDILVEWYLDLDEPTNISSFAINSDKKLASGDAEMLKFEHKFSVGTHTLTLFVTDHTLDYSANGTYQGDLETVSFLVEKGAREKDGEEEQFVTTVAIGAIVIIIIVIVIIFLLLFLRKRKPKTEREKLYGSDKGLKPGEAYVVEETDSTYFGDDLDRKGVTSLEGEQPPAAQPAPTTPQAPPAEPQPPIDAAKKPPELPPKQ